MRIICFSYYLVLHQKDACFILSVIQYDYDATESCIMCIYINDMLRTNGRREAPIEDGEPAGNIHIHINKLQHSCSKIRVNLVPIAIFNSLSIFLQ